MPITFAALLPHPPILIAAIGAGRERAAQRTLEAYGEVGAQLRVARPERLLLISTHGIVTLRRFHLLAAPLHGSLAPFGAPDCRIEQPHDRVLSVAIRRAAERDEQPLTTVEQWEPHDHSVLVPLSLLEDAVNGMPTVVVSVCFRSAAEHRQFGRSLVRAATEVPGATAVIASGDGAHTLRPDSPQGYHPQAALFQQAFEDALANWDIDALLGFDDGLRSEIDESVVSPTAILVGLLKGVASPRLLAAEAPWGVAYTTAILR